VGLHVGRKRCGLWRKTPVSIGFEWRKAPGSEGKVNKRQKQKKKTRSTERKVPDDGTQTIVVTRCFWYGRSCAESAVAVAVAIDCDVYPLRSNRNSSLEPSRAQLVGGSHQAADSVVVVAQYHISAAPSGNVTLGCSLGYSLKFVQYPQSRNSPGVGHVGCWCRSWPVTLFWFFFLCAGIPSRPTLLDRNTPSVGTVGAGVAHDGPKRQL